MSARSTFMHLAAEVGILFGALFLVSVLLAAIPGHRSPAVPVEDAQHSTGSESRPVDHSKMSRMEMDDAKANEVHAVHDMTTGRMDAHSLHMYMTEMRSQTPSDAAQANEIVKQLRTGIEKYKDYHVALNDGYKIFLPNLPQPESCWRHVHHAQARDEGAAQHTSATQHGHVASAHQSLHAARGAVPQCRLEQVWPPRQHRHRRSVRRSQWPFPARHLRLDGARLPV